MVAILKNIAISAAVWPTDEILLDMTHIITFISYDR